MEQPGGVSRFTIALNGAFCFRTYPLLRISWYRGVPFWNPLHLVAENSATKDHSAVLRAGSQADAYPPGCPQFWGDQSITVTPPGCFSLAYIFVTLRKC